MKLISVLALAALLALTSFSYADDPRARPGGYNEQVANKKSLASVPGAPCPGGTVYYGGVCVCI